MTWLRGLIDWVPKPSMAGGGFNGWMFALMFWAWGLAVLLFAWNFVRCFVWPLGPWGGR